MTDSNETAGVLEAMQLAEAAARGPFWGELQEARIALVRAEAEVERLRGALRWIADRHPDSAPGEHPACDFARAALDSPETPRCPACMERGCTLPTIFVDGRTWHDKRRMPPDSPEAPR